MDTKRSSLALSCCFLSGIGLLGAGGLTATDFAVGDNSIINGAYQRSIETRYAQGIPLLDRSVELYTATNLLIFGQTDPEVVIAGDDWLFTAEEFRTPSPEFDFVAEIRSTVAALSDLGIDLIPVIVPDKARIYADLLPRDRGPAIERRYDAILAELTALGLPAIDLRPVLIDGRADGDTFMRTDTHWSPHGADLAARSIAEVIGLITKQTNAFETIVRAGAPFHGDLMTFVDTGVFSDWVGIPPETIARAETRSTAGLDALFGDAAIDLALVGTSFSARAEFNFAGFVQQATGLDLVDFSVEGRGPFQPMRDVLVEGSLSDIQPHTVIWEIPERYVQMRDTQ